MKPTDIIAGLALILTATTIFIAYKQYIINKFNFKNTIYHRRYEVYEAIRDFLSMVVTDFTFNNQEFISYKKKVEHNQFLFGIDIQNYLKKLDEKCLRLKTLKKMGELDEKLLNESYELESWIATELEKLPNRFIKYLNLNHELEFKKRYIFFTCYIIFIGIYILTYGLSSGRYESVLNKIESNYNAFTIQLAAGASFSNKKLMLILNKKTPVQPKLMSPISVVKSLDVIHFYEHFYHSYNNLLNKRYESASDFRQDIINQWKNKLQGADFEHADLQDVDFIKANLEDANFIYAKLKSANFFKANLKGAFLAYADLENANFKATNLRNANFQDANLYRANFDGADLEKANLNFAEITAKQLIQAKSLYNVKNISAKVHEKLKEYGCELMVKEKADEWSAEFRAHREELIKKWKVEFYEKVK